MLTGSGVLLVLFLLFAWASGTLSPRVVIVDVCFAFVGGWLVERFGFLFLVVTLVVAAVAGILQMDFSTFNMALGVVMVALSLWAWTSMSKSQKSRLIGVAFGGAAGLLFMAVKDSGSGGLVGGVVGGAILGYGVAWFATRKSAKAAAG